MKIALVVDNPKRDLPGLVLLGMHLCQRGHTSIIVPMNLLYELFTLWPDFVLLNYLRPNNQEMVSALLKNDIMVGILDTEGGVFSNLDDFTKTVIPDVRLRSLISCYCCWGEELRKYCISNGYYLKDQIFSTGAPRFDYYQAPWNNAMIAFSSSIDSFSRPMVLINSNNTLANPQFQTPEEEAEMLINRFGHPRERIMTCQDIQRITMAEMTGLVNRLADVFPTITFVFRPHPFEKLSGYLNLLNNSSNIHLINEGTVDGWISRSICVIQRGCSTAIEANMGGIPALSPMWIKTCQKVEVTESVSVPCESPEDLIAIIRNILNGNFILTEQIRRNYEEIIKKWFTCIDGRSSERVADVLISKIQDDTPVRMKKRIIRYYLMNIGRTVLFWKKLKNVSGWDHSEKAFTPDIVKKMVNAINIAGKDAFKGEWAEIDVQPAKDRKWPIMRIDTLRSVILTPKK